MIITLRYVFTLQCWGSEWYHWRFERLRGKILASSPLPTMVLKVLLILFLESRCGKLLASSPLPNMVLKVLLTLFLESRCGKVLASSSLPTMVFKVLLIFFLDSCMETYWQSSLASLDTHENELTGSRTPKFSMESQSNYNSIKFSRFNFSLKKVLFLILIFLPLKD